MSLVVIYGALIFLASLGGGLIPLFIRETDERGLQLFVSLGAGLLLGIAFLHMMPEASRLVPDTFGMWILVGFVLLLVLERFVMVHACEEHGCNYHTVGLTAFAGLTVHGLIEGFALASTLFVSRSGPIVLFAILAHKIPAGVALTSILRLASRSKRRILGFLVGVSLSAPVGLAIALFWLQKRELPAVAGVLLSISAGTFLYIAACDLLPELHRGNRDKIPRLAFFFAGVILSFLSEHFVG